VRMIESYLNLFKDDVVEIRDASVSEIPLYMARNPKKIVYFPDIEGYSAIGNLWADRSRIEQILGKNFFNHHLVADNFAVF